MKILTILFSFFVMNSCGTSKNNNTANLAELKQIDDTYIFNYKATTRGSFKEIKVTPESITYQNGLSAKPITKPISKEAYQSLIEKVEALNLDDLKTLEAPSKAFQYDGALIANLKITTNNKSYQTTSFDHGNPPKLIKALVEELLSLSEKVE
ncbi:hypothetical protein [Mangrovimonas cancribranchiae]|uniref:Lipoprotein n=1 Tax=Mangrovimonas cancribranchiae TaxID=3080055 RepID=A0AAU6NVB9_9FLAO